MYKINVANGKLRGFLRHLFNASSNDFKFISKSSSSSEFYEKKGFFRRFLALIWNSELGDKLGLIQIINKSKDRSDLYFSYNRFVNTDKTPYVIYLENPTALYHYRLNRSTFSRGRKTLQKQISANNLKAIVCLSYACLSTFEEVTGIPKKLFEHKIFQNYPLIPENDLVSKESIVTRSSDRKIQFLFISSDFELKGGYELLEAIDLLRDLDFTIKIITDKSTISSKSKNRLNEIKEGVVEILPFAYTFDELQKMASESHVFVHPTFKDSFGLVILEVLKAGLPVISTNLYAIPEMVTNGENGFLQEPSIRYFDKRNLPNKSIWEDEKKIYIRIPDTILINFIEDKMRFYIENRNELKRHSLNSFQKSNTKPFSSEYIEQKWSEIFNRSIISQ